VIKPQRMEIVATGSWDKDRIIVIRDSLAVYQRTQEAVEKIKKGEIPAAAPIATNANAQMTTTVPTDEPQSHKVRNPKGREPATREAIQADNDIARRWQEFRTGEASGPDANRKPTLTDFSRSILNSTHLKTKQIEEALERVRKRKRMKSRLSGN